MKARAILAMACALVAAGCHGPRPRVVSSALRAPAAGEGPAVEAVVENEGSGEGQVAVEVTVRSPTGEVTRAVHDVTLHPRERLTVTVPLMRPIDDHADITVTVRYPVH